jgi:hypothetical protein
LQIPLPTAGSAVLKRRLCGTRDNECGVLSTALCSHQELPKQKADRNHPLSLSVVISVSSRYLAAHILSRPQAYSFSRIPSVIRRIILKASSSGFGAASYYSRKTMAVIPIAGFLPGFESVMQPLACDAAAYLGPIKRDGANGNLHWKLVKGISR